MSVYAVHNQEPKFIFIINFKVMYSSLYEILPEYFPGVKFQYKGTARRLNFGNYPKYAIVRNPFSRVVSTYYDKCKQAPQYGLTQEKSQLQYCQHQLLNAINIIRKTDNKLAEPANYYTLAENTEKRKLLDENFETLISLSFEEYVECLSMIFSKEAIDGHFERQYKAFDVPSQNPFYNPLKVFKNTKILKLENIDQDWNTFCADVGIKMELRSANKTNHKRQSYKEYYSDETRKVVAGIYKKDFKKFKYSIEM